MFFTFECQCQCGWLLLLICSVYLQLTNHLDLTISPFCELPVYRRRHTMEAVVAKLQSIVISRAFHSSDDTHCLLLSREILWMDATTALPFLSPFHIDDAHFLLFSVWLLLLLLTTWQSHLFCDNLQVEWASEWTSKCTFSPSVCWMREFSAVSEWVVLISFFSHLHPIRSFVRSLSVANQLPPDNWIGEQSNWPDCRAFSGSSNHTRSEPRQQLSAVSSITIIRAAAAAETGACLLPCFVWFVCFGLSVCVCVCVCAGMPLVT